MLPAEIRKRNAMKTDDNRDDVEAIKAIIARQFESLNWRSGTPADWDTFAADFFPGATLYPAARLVRSQTVQAFIDRMKDLAGSRLRSFVRSSSNSQR
jgi:hypothetical protein